MSNCHRHPGKAGGSPNQIASRHLLQTDWRLARWDAHGRLRAAERPLANARNGLLRSMSGFGCRRPDCQVRFAVYPFASAAWR
jgi:hypothetical protein